MGHACITPDDLLERWRENRAIQLLDVRTPAEFAERHVEFARNVPLDQLDPAVLRDGGLTGERAIYVICRSGSRGRQACEWLIQAGCKQVVNVDGGTLACEQAGLPMVRGQRVMSLERQVRIAAGMLVLLGVLLGWFVHPVLFVLAALVGGGLVFAGITDTCGLGMLLARMPWNRAGTGSRCPANQ